MTANAASAAAKVADHHILCQAPTTPRETDDLFLEPFQLATQGWTQVTQLVGSLLKQVDIPGGSCERGSCEQEDLSNELVARSPDIGCVDHIVNSCWRTHTPSSGTPPDAGVDGPPVSDAAVAVAAAAAAAPCRDKLNSDNGGPVSVKLDAFDVSAALDAGAGDVRKGRQQQSRPASAPQASSMEGLCRVCRQRVMIRLSFRRRGRRQTQERTEGLPPRPPAGTTEGLRRVRR